MSDAVAERQLPKYECHKIVHALKIKAVDDADHGGVWVIPEDEHFAKILETEQWLRRCLPMTIPDEDTDMGYYVVYEDGYTSWSPSPAFEKGYTRVE